jgi:hypothetical protein
VAQDSGRLYAFTNESLRLPSLYRFPLLAFAGWFLVFGIAHFPALLCNRRLAVLYKKIVESFAQTVLRGRV